MLRFGLGWLWLTWAMVAWGASFSNPYRDQAQFLGDLNPDYYHEEFLGSVPQGQQIVNLGFGPLDYAQSPYQFRFPSIEGQVSYYAVKPTATGTEALSIEFPQAPMSITNTASAARAIGGRVFLTDNAGDLTAPVDSGTGLPVPFNITVYLSDGSWVTSEDLYSSTDPGQLPFWGYIADGGLFVTGLAFTRPAVGVAYATFENVIVGVGAVPEPQGWLAISSAGLLVFALGRRMRPPPK